MTYSTRVPTLIMRPMECDVNRIQSQAVPRVERSGGALVMFESVIIYAHLW